MHRAFIWLLVVGLVAGLSGASVSQKITVDPNAPGAQAADDADSADGKTDPRLRRVVTYESRQKRLSAVLHELSDATGVVIRTGTNRSDWQIRDMPVTVCAREMPLGRLLTTIAESTHLVLGAEKIEDRISYRISRSGRIERLLSSFWERKRTAGQAISLREWDMALSLASTDESRLVAPSSEGPVIEEMPQDIVVVGPGEVEPIRRSLTVTRVDPGRQLHYARNFSRLLAALGPGAKERLLAGEAISVDPASAQGRLREALDTLIANAWEERSGRHVSFPTTHSVSDQPSLDDLAAASVTLYLKDWWERPRLEGRVDIPVRKVEGSAGAHSLGLDLRFQVISCMTRDNIKDFAQPQEIYIPVPPRDPVLAEKYTSEPSPSEGTPFLERKLKLEKPKDLDMPTIADALAALSKAADISIVCEDFESHKLARSGDSVFGREKTVSELLDALGTYFNWFVDEENRLIVGTAQQWPDCRRDLVPESLLATLRARLEKGGVDLDDAVPLAMLTREQWSEWVAWSRDLSALSLISFESAKPLWTFYASLSAEDKALAKSEPGLPLMKFDPVAMAEVLQAHNSALARSVQDPSERALRELPADPALVPGLSFKVMKNDVWMKCEMRCEGGGMGTSTSISSISPGQEPPKDMLRKSCYSIEISGARGGQPFQVRGDGPSGFPLYTLKWQRSEKGISTSPSR